MTTPATSSVALCEQGAWDNEAAEDALPWLFGFAQMTCHTSNGDTQLLRTTLASSRLPSMQQGVLVRDRGSGLQPFSHVEESPGVKGERADVSSPELPRPPFCFLTLYACSAG